MRLSGAIRAHGREVPAMNLGTNTLQRTASGLVAGLLALTMLFVVGSASAASASASASTSDTVSAPTGSVAKNANGKMKSTVTGKTAGGGKLSGTFTPLKFKQADGALVAKGVLHGVIKAADGTKSTFTTIRSLEVTQINGATLEDLAISSGAASACDILNLVLGPLDLNVLGLEVHLKKVVLDIVAVTGAGNLLGNLLCAVAGLLDGGLLAGLLGQLTTLLNQILAALGLGI